MNGFLAATSQKRRYFALAIKTFFIVVFVFSLASLSNWQKLNAAGIDNVTAALTVDTVGLDTQITVSFSPNTALVNGNTITIYFGEDSGGDPFVFGGVLTTDIVCDDFGSEGTWTTDTVTAASPTLPANVQITATVADAGDITCVIGSANFPNNPAGADGYSIGVVTTSDQGAGIAYVGNGNDVTITAAILPLLTLTLDNPGGLCSIAAGIATCPMGIQTTAAVTEGNYDVNALTNAVNGVTVQVDADAELNDGANDINPVVEGNTVVLGTEGYGIAVAADGGLTEQGDFTDDDTPVPTGGPTTVVSSIIPISTQDTTITHRVAIGAATPVGSYDQIVTWTASANF